MSSSFVLTIDGHPQPKQRPRTYQKNGKSRTITPIKTLKREKAIRWTARAQGLQQALEGPVAVHLVFYTLNTGADVDNLAKLVLDALHGIAYADDRQVMDLRSTKVYVQDACEERTVVHVAPYLLSPLPDWAP